MFLCLGKNGTDSSSGRYKAILKFSVVLLFSVTLIVRLRNMSRFGVCSRIQQNLNVELEKRPEVELF